MARDEDVTAKRPVVGGIDGPPERVYVGPRAIPQKTKVPTLEMQTVQVKSDPDPRRAPTIRLRRERLEPGSQEEGDVPLVDVQRAIAHAKEASSRVLPPRPAPRVSATPAAA